MDMSSSISPYIFKQLNISSNIYMRVQIFEHIINSFGHMIDVFERIINLFEQMFKSFTHVTYN